MESDDFRPLALVEMALIHPWAPTPVLKGRMTNCFDSSVGGAAAPPENQGNAAEDGVAVESSCKSGARC
jgi:hypothetical protein